MVFKQILIFILCSLSIKSIAQKTFHLDSPSGEMRLTVKVSDSVYYSIHRGQQTVITESNIALLISVGNLGVQPKLKTQKRRTVREQIINPVPFKRKVVPDHFNELTSQFRNNYSVIFRAYDDGIAYRCVTGFKDSLEVISGGYVAKIRRDNG